VVVEGKHHVVYIVSDATGATGQRVVQAALAQFATCPGRKCTS
jgi:regulator of PEP synthase PpsR (kinase-PPPase family)